MKRFLFIMFLIIVLSASCEKNADQPYTLKFYGDAYEDIGYSVSILNDGYVIAGQLEDIKRDGDYINSGNKNMGVIKTGWDGEEDWKVNVGGKFGDRGSKIYQLTDGSMICVGTFTDTTTAVPVQTDIFLVKISSSGDVAWEKAFGGAGNQTGSDIIKTPDGFMILGTTDVERQPLTDSTGNIAGNKDIFLLKINDNGDFVDSFAFGYPGNDIGTVIKPDLGGDYIVLGTTDRSDPGEAKNNMILIRINSIGAATQPRILGGPEDEYAADLEVLSDGYLVAGTVGKDGDDQSISVTRLTEDIYAAPVTHTFQINNASSGAKALSTYKVDSYLLAGQWGPASSSDMLIIELDADGNPVKGKVMIKGSTGVQVANDVVSGDDGYIIAAGKNSYDVNSMISFFKFRF